MTDLFISIGRMPFLAQILDNANPLFALAITPGFYLDHVEVTDQEPASSLDFYMYTIDYLKEILISFKINTSLVQRVWIFFEIIFANNWL